MLTDTALSAFVPKLTELALAQIAFLASPAGSKEKQDAMKRRDEASKVLTMDERRMAAAYAVALKDAIGYR